MQTRLSEQSKLERQTASQLSGIHKDLFKVLIWVQRTPSVTHGTGRVYDRLVDQTGHARARRLGGIAVYLAVDARPAVGLVSSDGPGVRLG